MKIPGIVCVNSIKRFSAFVYPSFCLHCGAKLPSVTASLCNACTSLVEWLDTEETCKLCATPLNNRMGQLCSSCKKQGKSLQPHCSLFSSYSPLTDLLNRFDRRSSKRVAAAFAGLTVVRLFQLGWPWPDVIIPIPDDYSTMGSVKQEGVMYIARELGDLLSAEILFPFRSHGYCQLKKQVRPLPGKHVLLIQAHLWETEPLLQARRAVRCLFTQNIRSLALAEHR